ncbi:MAG: CoA-binding protein [Chloroflexota bacterium]|nr:MAG: CoA-binding protein [Chloroflexota bacterium]
MNQAIEDFVRCKRIAVVGYSRNPQKFGPTAYKELKERGYEVFAVHPTEKEINGEVCYPNLAALSGKADGVLVSVNPQQSAAVVQEAAAAGFHNIWLQAGAESPEAIEAGQKLGLSMATGKCILMYAQPVRSFHAVHRLFARVFGGL